MKKNKTLAYFLAASQLSSKPNNKHVASRVVLTINGGYIKDFNIYN